MRKDTQSEKSGQSKVTGLREYVKSLQESNPAVGACRHLSDKVGKWCSKHFGEENVTLRQGYFKGGDKLAQHFYIKIEHNNRTWIADPTIRQFTYDNWLNGKADTYISKSEIPDVGVIDDSMSVFKRYE